MLQKGARLSDNSEISLVFRKGKPFLVYPLHMKVMRNDTGVTRMAFLAPAKVFPKATERNRVKRVLREAFRSLQTSFPVGYDVIVYLTRRQDLTIAAARNAAKSLSEKLK